MCPPTATLIYNNINMRLNMVKSSDNRAYAKLKQHQALKSILGSSDPVAALEEELKNKNSVFLQMADVQRLAPLRALLVTVGKGLLDELEQAVRIGSGAVDGVETRIARYLAVQRSLLKNQTYAKEVGEALASIQLRVLVWSSKMALSEETLRIVSEFSFDKSLKLYYYYFKYYMSHLNLFYPDQIKIKHLFAHNPSLHFGFVRFPGPGTTSQPHDSKFLISIPDLREYFRSYSLTPETGLNHYTGACLINTNYRLGLSEDDEIFHALMLKIKFVLTQDRNSLVRAVLYAYWVFAYLEIEFLKSDEKMVGVPEIFALPPDYTRIVAEFLEIFFEQDAMPETHLAILTIIDSILAVEQKVGNKDFQVSMAINTPLILKLLQSINNSLANPQKSTRMQPEGQQASQSPQVPICTINNKQVLQKLIFVLSKQMVETTELHNQAQQLATSIFMKKVNMQFSDNIIVYSGLILIIVEADQQQFLNFSVEQIKANKEKAHPYLKVINMLFEAKYVRQRRDFNTIARLIAQSQIFPILAPIIQQQSQSTVLDEKSFTYTTMILMGKICEENPALVDVLAGYDVMDLLLNFLTKFESINHFECISNSINFLHYISLKEGEVREKVMKNVLAQYISKMFSSNFIEYVNSKNFSQVFSPLEKFISNINLANAQIVVGIVLSLRNLLAQSRILPKLQTLLTAGSAISQETLETVSAINTIDSRLNIIVKLIDRLRQRLFRKLGIQFYLFIYRPLFKLCFQRGNVFIDYHQESRVLVNLMVEMWEICQVKYNNRLQGEEIQEEGQREERDREISDFISNFADMGQEIENQNDGNAVKHEEMDIEKNDPEDKKKNKYEQLFTEIKGEEKLKYLQSRLQQLTQTITELSQHNNFTLQTTSQKFHDSVLQAQSLTTTQHLQLNLALAFSRLDKVLYFMHRESITQIVQQPQYMDIFTNVEQSILPLVINSVTAINADVILRYLGEYKGVAFENHVLKKRDQNTIVISEEVLSGVVYGRLCEKWTHYHFIVESLSKNLWRFIEKYQEKFVLEHIRRVLKPLLQYNMSIAEQLEQKPPSQLTISDLQKIRFPLKIILQVLDASEQRRSMSIHNPFNQILAYYMYSEPQPLLFRLLTRYSNIISSVPIDMNSRLEDSPQNRLLCLKRIMLKMIRSRIKVLINKIFNFNIFANYATEIVGEKEENFKAFMFTMGRIYSEFCAMMQEMSIPGNDDHLNMSIIRDEINLKLLQFLNKKQHLIKKSSLFHNIKAILPQNKLQYNQMEALLMQKSTTLYNWMKNNLDKNLVTSDFTLNSKLGYNLNIPQMRYVENEVENMKTEIKISYKQLCEQVVLLSLRMFKDYRMSWGVPGRRKQLLMKSVYQALQKQSQQVTQSYRQDVLKLANICTLFCKKIQHSINLGCFNQNDLIFTTDFMTGLIEFVAEVIGNLEVVEGEDKFKEEGDKLVHEACNLLKWYNDYQEQLTKIREANKKEKKKLLKRVNRSKNETKRLKRLRKKKQQGQNQQSESRQPKQSYEEEVNQGRKQRKSRRKRRQDKNKLKTMTRAQSLANLHNDNKSEAIQSHQSKKKQLNKSQQKLSKKQKSLLKSKDKLKKSVQTFLINSLACSQNHPYLKNATLHELMNFILRVQESQKTKAKILYNIDVLEILPYLLRARICQIKHEGYFHKLSEFVVNLIQPAEVMVNSEVAIKRIFFENNTRQLPMSQYRKRINKKNFNIGPITHANLGYLLQIKKFRNNEEQEKKPKQRKKPVIKESSSSSSPPSQSSSSDQLQQAEAIRKLHQLINYSNRKRDEPPKQAGRQDELIEYTFSSYSRQQYSETSFVVLQPNVELHLINYNLSSHLLTNSVQATGQSQPPPAKDRKQRKSGHAHQQQPRNAQSLPYTPIKTIEYVPNRSLQICMAEIVGNITRLIARSMQEREQLEIEGHMQEQSRTEGEVADVFNITILVQVIQVLIRECPCVAPFVAKYKCRKIIMQYYQTMGPKSRKLLNSMLNLESKKQISLLSYLIKAISPLFFNRSFTLIFQMCLDNTVLQKQKYPLPTITQPPENKQPAQSQGHIGSQPNTPKPHDNQHQQQQSIANQQQQSYVTFGHVVRQRALYEIQEQLFKVEGFVRKMSVINLLTMLMSIRQFSKLCIDTPNFITNLQQLYITTLNSIKSLNLPTISMVAKRLLIPYYVSPITLLLQINISLLYTRKQRTPIPRLSNKLTKQSIAVQMVPATFFHSTKFQSTWPFTDSNDINLGFDIPEEYDDTDSSQDQSQSMGSEEEDADEGDEMDGVELERFMNQEGLEDEDGDGEEVDRELHTHSWLGEEGEGMGEEGIDEGIDGDSEDGEDDSSESSSSGDDDGHPEGRRLSMQIYPQDIDEIEEMDEDSHGYDDIIMQSALDQEGQSNSSQEEGYPDFSQALPEDMFNIPELQIQIDNANQLEGLPTSRNNDKNARRKYKEYDDIISHDRGDPKNFVYKTERQQEAAIRMFLSFANKKEERLSEIDKKFKKIGKDQRQIFKDYESSFLMVIDDPDLLKIAEDIEFKNFQMFEAFFWSLPSIEANQNQDTENQIQRRDIFGFDTFMHSRSRGRSRRYAVMRNELVPGNDGRSNLLNLMNHFTGIEEIQGQNHPFQIHESSPLRPLRVDSALLRPVRIRRMSAPVTRQEGQHNQEVQGQQLHPIIESPEIMDSIEHHRERLRNSQGNIREEEGQEHDQSPNDEEEVPEEDINDMELMQDYFMENYGAEDGEQYLGMSLEQVNLALQSQGFSMQNFMNLPVEIRNDILVNIRDQNRVNEQYLNNPHPPTPVRQEQPINSPQLQPANTHHLDNPPSQQLPAAPASDEAPEQYKKLSIQHIKKTNRDLIYMLNKQGKHNNKYTESSDEFIEGVLELLYILSDNDHVHFPYNLLASMLVNSANEERLLADLMSILMQGPGYRQKQGQLPRTIFINNQQEFIDNYFKCGYSEISLKVLHLLAHLSKSYSIAMSLLHVQGKNTKNMDITGIETPLRQNTMLQNLINLLQYSQIRQEPLNLDFLLNIVNQVTTIKFNYHIHNVLLSLDKGKEKDKEKEKEKEKGDKHEKSRTASLQLTQENNSLLFSLLQSDLLKENTKNTSKIIMRLSIEDTNLNNFILFFQKIIRNLAQKTTKSLIQTHQKYGNEHVISHKTSYKEKMYKTADEPIIVQLMNIFYDIIKSMKTSIASEQKHVNLLTQFREILECQEIKELCEQGCEIIDSNPSNPQLLSKIHEFIDCFFAIFNILQDKTFGPKQNKDKDKNEPHIATLGKVSENVHALRRQSLKRKFTSTFIDLQGLFQKKICTPQGKAFINANIRNKLNSVLKGNRKFRQSLFEIPIIVVAIQTPHMLEFDNKKSLFKAELKRIRQKRVYDGLHLVVNRSDVFQQSFQQFMNRRPDELKGKLKIQFQGEQGQDVGGLTREWFQLLSKQMFNPGYALFQISSTGSTYRPSEKSYINNDHLNYFRFIGRVMGKALHDGYLLDAYFTSAFYKHILSIPITYKDLQEQDFQFYKSLKWILENSPVEDYLQEYFTYTYDNFGETAVQNLIPGGEQIRVTEQNKIEYVQLISYARMAKSLQKQYQNLLQGFHEFVPSRVIRIFDEKQLEIMISGLPTVDIEDLRKNTQLVNYHKTDQIIIWLFQVLQTFDMSLRTAFLQFVTGTSRVPAEGFKALQGFNGPQKFNIHKMYDVKHLPRSHTCFNQLDLPSYESKEILIEKLTLAITEGKEGFGII